MNFLFGFLAAMALTAAGGILIAEWRDSRARRNAMLIRFRSGRLLPGFKGRGALSKSLLRSASEDFTDRTRAPLAADCGPERGAGRDSGAPLSTGANRGSGD